MSAEIRYAKVEYDPDDIRYQRPKKATLVIAVSEPDWGFGEFAFVQDETGQLFLDTECSGRERVQEMVAAWISSAIIDSDQDPDKHRRYCEVMQRTCGDGCEICKSTKKK